MQLRILLIDDQPASVESLCAELKKMPDTKFEVVNFDGLNEGMATLAPNIIVLDLAQGNPSDANTPGVGTFEEIWKNQFCPLVIYTALPELLENDRRLAHPFIKLEQKGSGSEDRVVARIREFEPHLSALDGAGIEIKRAMNQAFMEVAPRIFEREQEPAQRNVALVRSVRRRVAAAMDQKLSSGGPNLATWEHYLYPPMVRGYPLTGDIIRKHAGDPNDPSQYAVVLTPSCDLVSGDRRRPKVKRVLVASCKDVGRLLQELAPADRENEGERKIRLRAMLTQGHGHSCLPLPELPGIFPHMAADFRDLDLVDFDKISDGDGKQDGYDRIASVDSPFRELVAWAYVLCAARPGLPDRDFDSWVEEIVSTLPEPRQRA